MHLPLLRRVHTALAIILCWLPVGTSSATSLEYKLKALCVLNAARLVTWEGQAAGATEPFVIGIIGENPFGGALEAAVKSETIYQRRIVVRTTTVDEAARSCQIVFISRSEAHRLRPILDKLASRQVLTMSEIEGFAEAGGAIGLALDQGKLRFEINRAAARASRLKIDSRLLSLAKVIR